MIESYRCMRLMVMFDLPVETKDERKEYRKFYKALQRNGFIMLQYSVYTRFCSNESECEKYTNRVIINKPKWGSVRLIKITDIQFNKMITIIGDESEREVFENKETFIEID